MRASVDTYGAKLVKGDAYVIGPSRHGIKGRCFLQTLDGGGPGVEVEDPGWPCDAIVMVITGGWDQAVIERTDATWRRDDVGGWRGALARWVQRNVSGMKPTGETDMIGEIYEGLVVKSDVVAAGPNSDKSVSKIIYMSGPFVARDDKTASGIVLSQAIAKDSKIDANDVEVRVRRWQ